MSRRAPRVTLDQEVAGPVRAAFEPRYRRALGDDEVGEIADNFRRFHDVLATWDAEDRAGLGPGGVRAANTPPTRSPDAASDPSTAPQAHPDLPPPLATPYARRR